MPLVFTETLTVTNDSLQFILTDTTGVYNATTNPGGWGGPNVDKNLTLPFFMLYDNVKQQNLTPIEIYRVTPSSAPFEYPLLGGDDWVLPYAGNPMQPLFYPPAYFSMFTVYGRPYFEDGVYTLFAKIIDNSGIPSVVVSEFSLVVPVTTQIDCCISSLATKLAYDTDFTKDEYMLWNYMMQKRLAFDYAVGCGKYEEAYEFLQDAQIACSETGCGCGCS